MTIRHHNPPGLSPAERQALNYARWKRTHPEWFLRHQAALREMKQASYRRTMLDPERRARHRDTRKKYARLRRAQDPSFRIAGSLRVRLRGYLRLGERFASTERLIGCSFEELKTMIEVLFLPGMSWDNYGAGIGKWGIDHIIPCASFDFTDKEQQIKCFHYSNLRPLWHCDNARKGCKILLDIHNKVS